MQKKGQNQSLSETNKGNYIVPKGEEQLVHYLVERVRYEGQVRVSKPTLVKTPVSMFDMVMRNLELQGNRVEIVWHPQGKYNNPEPLGVDVKEMQNKVKEAEKAYENTMAEFEAYKAEMEAKLAEAEAKLSAKETKEVAETKKAEETKEETPTESAAEVVEKKKAGRPSKGGK